MSMSETWNHLSRVGWTSYLKHVYTSLEMTKTRTIHIYYYSTEAKKKCIHLLDHHRTTTRQSTYTLSRIRLMISLLSVEMLSIGDILLGAVRKGNWVITDYCNETEISFSWLKS